MSNINEEIQYKNFIKSSDDISNTLFTEKYYAFLYLETIIMNWKLKNRKSNYDNYMVEIDWTKIAIIAMYDINGFQTIKNRNKKEIYEGIKEHVNEIFWNRLLGVQYLPFISIDFMMRFKDIILSQTENQNLSFIIDIMIINGIISMDELSEMENIPNEILIKYADDINWEKFISKHGIKFVPVECMNRENFIVAVRNNPDLMNIKGDKQSLSEINERLKKYVWVDRVAGVEGHYQDDTGLWLDTLRGEAADDADNLESDLEHSKKDAYGEIEEDEYEL